MYMSKQNQRFTKLFKKLNSSYQERSVTHLPQSSTDNSFYNERSLYSQEMKISGMQGQTTNNGKFSVKGQLATNNFSNANTSNSYLKQSYGNSVTSSLIGSYSLKDKLNSTKISQQQAMMILFQRRRVILNRQLQKLQFEFIPTSNGFRIVLKITETFFINLSWLHSLQQLQPLKILILFYDMQSLTSQNNSNPSSSSLLQQQRQKLPKIQSLIIEFESQKQLAQVLSALTFVHQKYHDEDIQKFYHLLCGQDKKK